MQLELSAFVEADLDTIAAFIAEDNPGRALTFIRDIRSKFRAIQRSPLLYQLRPDIGEDARMGHRRQLRGAFSHRRNHRAHRAGRLRRPRSPWHVRRVVGLLNAVYCPDQRVRIADSAGLNRQDHRWDRAARNSLRVTASGTLNEYRPGMLMCS